jgi:retinol dehydrogenase-12
LNDRQQDLVGRTCLVTGANTGIGRAIATGLAHRGGRVLLACRSADRAREVVDEIATSGGAGCAEHVPLDLADLASVRACGRLLARQGERLHVLVNNAGVAGQRGVTEQGFELAFGVNHLGHFLLTMLLLEPLRTAGRARIVNLASRAHYGAKGIDFDAVRQRTRTPAGLVEYQMSKLCNVLFTRELARRLDGVAVTSYAVDPGVVASDIWRRVPWPVRPAITRFMASTEDGARTPLQCATAPGFEAHDGCYFQQGEVQEPSPVATAELAAELWLRSEVWTRPFC